MAFRAFGAALIRARRSLCGAGEGVLGVARGGHVWNGHDNLSLLRSLGPQRSFLRRICFAKVDELEVGRVYGCYAFDKGDCANRLWQVQVQKKRPLPVVFMERLPAFRVNQISICPLMSPDPLNKAFGQRSAKARMVGSRTYVPVMSHNPEVETSRYNDYPRWDPTRMEPPLPIDVSYVCADPYEVRLQGVDCCEHCNKKEYMRSYVNRGDFIFTA